MAARKKAKSARRAKSKKAVKRTKAKAAQKSTAKRKVAKPAAKKKAVAKRAVAKRARRAMPKPRPKANRRIGTLVVDTVEEPVPGVVVVTETEYSVERSKPDSE